VDQSTDRRRLRSNAAALGSARLFAEAQALIPGGVNSPVRAFKAVGGAPRFLARGLGARVWDVDGDEYLDCVGSWGPLILGHARPEVIAAACEAARRGTTFGAPTELEVELARAIVEAVPSIELVRLVNSGTEAAMSAVRLARAYTGRTKVVKFEGGYHGHSDGLLAQAGSGLATLSLPGSPGVPPSWAAETLVVPYNDAAVAAELMRTRGDQIACVLVEPVAGNMGVVAPADGFLETLRQATREAGALLVFDEVITGFRVGYGGAQSLYRVQPDLTVLGKIIGGGFPIGAFGGPRAIMEMLAPVGPVYQAGTLSGNPVACAAGLATLRLLAKERPYAELDRRGEALAAGLRQAAARAGLPATVNRVGSMLTLFFQQGPVVDHRTAMASDVARYAAFFQHLLARGIYLPPSQFEAMFLSSAHGDNDVARICEAAGHALQAVAAG
jgi:glutamate-1-semialdehyde 2,1-aminomutase